MENAKMIAGVKTIAIIGLGYVGLPLAAEFAKHRPVVGFDINPRRVDELRNGYDATREVSKEELDRAAQLSFTTNPSDIETASIFIVTVPTPIDAHKQPDLAPLLKASQTVGSVLKKGDLVIYESTVYPGATEEECVPILEQASGLTCNVDFFVGYSPERINPGDKTHRLPDIVKVTSGSTPSAAEEVDQLYSSIISAGTYKANSIRVAEAAKVIENTQRDLNIALVNEFAIIFNRMNIDTADVLNAAGTKWNFLPFRPGLVGGHCISVDPYYLTHKAQALGYHPQVILAGRRINDAMGIYVAEQVIKQMLKRKIQVNGSRVLVLGLTFKENCPDLRNTRVIDIIREMHEYGVIVECHDPLADANEAFHEYGIKLLEQPKEASYDAVLLVVAHDEYREKGADALRRYGKDQCVFYDLKSAFPVSQSDLRL